MSTVLIADIEGSTTGFVDLSLLPDEARIGGLNANEGRVEKPRTVVKAGRFHSVEQAVGEDEQTRNKWEDWRAKCREAIAVRAQA